MAAAAADHRRHRRRAEDGELSHGPFTTRDRRRRAAAARERRHRRDHPDGLAPGRQLSRHLGQWRFAALRYKPDGSENPEFVLNQPRYRGAPILLAGANFGCGSSREGAVWALHAIGVRCVIAPSFGDIFFNNCFQNGMLPVVLAGRRWRAWLAR